jgi:hypothetical protein
MQTTPAGARFDLTDEKWAVFESAAPTRSTAMIRSSAAAVVVEGPNCQ